MNMGQQICGRRGRGLAAVRKRRLPSSWVIWTASQPRVLTRYLCEAAHSGGRSGTLVGDLWASKREVSTGSMFCTVSGPTRAGDGSTGAARGAPAWEMVVRWVKGCRINELLVLSLSISSSELEDRPQNRLREHLDPGHKITRISV